MVIDVEPQVDRSPTRSRRQRRRAILATVLALVVGGFGWWELSRGPSPSATAAASLRAIGAPLPSLRIPLQPAVSSRLGCEVFAYCQSAVYKWPLSERPTFQQVTKSVDAWATRNRLTARIGWLCGPRYGLFGSFGGPACQVSFGLPGSATQSVFVAVTFVDPSKLEFDPVRAPSNLIPGTTPALQRELVASISSQVIVGVH